MQASQASDLEAAAVGCRVSDGALYLALRQGAGEMLARIDGRQRVPVKRADWESSSSLLHLEPGRARCSTSPATRPRQGASTRREEHGAVSGHGSGGDSGLDYFPVLSLSPRRESLPLFVPVPFLSLHCKRSSAPQLTASVNGCQPHVVSAGPWPLNGFSPESRQGPLTSPCSRSHKKIGTSPS